MLLVCQKHVFFVNTFIMICLAMYCVHIFYHHEFQWKIFREHIVQEVPKHSMNIYKNIQMHFTQEVPKHSMNIYKNTQNLYFFLIKWLFPMLFKSI